MHPPRPAVVFSVALLLTLHSAHSKAAGGRVVIAEGGKRRVVVVDRESRAVIHENTDFRRVEWFGHGREQWFPSKSRVSCIQHLPGGEVLLCEPDLHRVAIADRDGAIVWELPNLEYPWRALYIP